MVNIDPNSHIEKDWPWRQSFVIALDWALWNRFDRAICGMPQKFFNYYLIIMSSVIVFGFIGVFNTIVFGVDSLLLLGRMF